jgi:hypothetical protein
MFEDFRRPLSSFPASGPDLTSAETDKQTVQAAYESLILSLPPLNRHLLLYLLDILAVFAFKEQLNNMTVHRLAAIFQPVILAPTGQVEVFSEEEASRNISRQVVVFLIEDQDQFVFKGLLQKELTLA